MLIDFVLRLLPLFLYRNGYMIHQQLLPSILK